MIHNRQHTWQLIVLLAIAACADPPSDCGTRPLRPGYAVAFGNNRAVLSRNDWLALEAYTRALEEWGKCLQVP